MKQKRVNGWTLKLSIGKEVSLRTFHSFELMPFFKVWIKRCGDQRISSFLLNYLLIVSDAFLVLLGGLS
jgi:hypothetical protein